MVNNNIQGVVSLEGRGVAAKARGNFQPGEYLMLSNAQIKNGSVQSRYNVRSFLPEDVVVPSVTKAFPILGYWFYNTLVSSPTEHFAYAVLDTPNSGTKTALWSPALLPKNVHASSFHFIVGFFEYNKRLYWLTWEYNGTTLSNIFHLYHIASPAGAGDLPGITFASLTNSIIFTVTSQTLEYRDFFIHKERLWVVTDQGLYASKSIDPTIFTVPDGYFLVARDDNINHAFSCRDQIYVLTRKTIKVMSYSTNPNTDSYIRDVTVNMGAYHGTSFKEEAFVTNYDGVYAVSPNGVELVKDDFDSQESDSKLVAWDDYLIRIAFTSNSYSFYKGNPRYIKDLRSTVTISDPAVGARRFASTVWFINMLNGSTHTLDFWDQYANGVSPGVPNGRGNITDMMFNPNQGRDSSSFGGTKGPLCGLMIMTYRNFGNFGCHLYHMNRHEDVPLEVYDHVIDSNNIVRRKLPYFQVEIDSYVPDGNEYLMKKFRSLEMMANLPLNYFELLVSYDNRLHDPIGTGIVFSQNLTGATDAKPPFPCKAGLNQRARSISFRFRTMEPFDNMSDLGITNWEFIDISDLRVLWAYTNRGPTRLNQSPTT